MGKHQLPQAFTQVLRKEEKQRAKKQYRTMFMPGQFKLSSSSSSVAAASLCPHLCPHLQLGLFFAFLLLEFLVPRHDERSANAAATSTDDDSLNPESVRDRQGLV